MKHPSRCVSLLVALVVCGWALSCGASDPKLAIQLQRAKWTVELQDWTAKDDGTVTLSVRVSGPPSTKLEQLTFLVTFFDAAEQPIAEVWQSIELSRVPRGAPTDMLFGLGPIEGAVEGLSTRLVLQPTPEQEKQIRELQL